MSTPVIGDGAAGRSGPCLRELQRRVAVWLLHGDPLVRSCIGDTPAASAIMRLRAQSAAYRLRLIETLEGAFPALRATLGEEPFACLGRAYADARPSLDFRIRTFGAGLAEFLRTVAPWSSRPGLASFASLEWALGEARDAEDAPVLGSAPLAGLPAYSRVRLCLHPSVRILNVTGNALMWWQAWQIGEPKVPSMAAGELLHCLVWRRDCAVQFRAIAAPQAQALRMFCAGASCAQVHERLREQAPGSAVPDEPGGLIDAWARAGLLCGMVLS